tara:strand:- start:38 stop:232 length:195 start_codon:yes stop_codon:yes gene_type:complete
MTERVISYKSNNGKLFTTEAEARDDDAYSAMLEEYRLEFGARQLHLRAGDMKSLYELLKGYYNE